MKLLTTICALILCFGLSAQSVTLNDVPPTEVGSKAFKLNQSTLVTIEGQAGLFRDDYQYLIYYSWIVDTESREVVWHLMESIDRDDFEDADGFIEFSFDEKLDPGTYELYQTGSYQYQNWSNSWSINDFGDFMDALFSSRNFEKFRPRYLEDLSVTVSGSGLREVDIEDAIDEKLSSAIVTFIRAGDNESFEQGFNLTGPAELQVYAIGEGTKDEVYDYVWIIDAVNRRRVFEMDYRSADFAGGAEKNLKIDETIALPEGSYVVSYRSDGSHSFNDWNAMPPDDPHFWGVVVFPSSSSDARKVEPFDPPETARPVVSIVDVRNSDLESTGFTLKKDMELTVLCIGERNYDDDMADYGWIVDAETRDVVWKMKEYRTDHAGGASKNRRIEENIELKAGQYIAYYQTDGSHSPQRWNAARPHEEDLYGITLWANNESDINKIETFDPRNFKAKNVLAEIMMVGDDDYEKEPLLLKQRTTVRIVAVGEGDDGDMYDYGWIRDMDTGKIVWEMKYYDTDHAGGARKNRQISETITLPAGDYMVYYETDGSHSFKRWNASPPSDPQSYGIRVLKTD